MNDRVPDLAAVVFVVLIAGLCICLVSYALDAIRHLWWKRRFWSAEREKIKNAGNLARYWQEHEGEV